MQKYWPEKRYHGKENVWEGFNQITKESVILKYFPMDSVEDYKVSREAYTMKYLFNEDPKHFLELYDYMVDNNENQYIIAMERADCSLEDIITDRGFLPEEEAIPLLREILYALKVMHKNNYIHRDLKLSNILLRSKNDLTTATIIDFGETVDRTDEYQVSGIVGTLHYMAPEILKKKKYGKPVDIWAFGVITYRLLTGYFPFMVDGNNHSKQLKTILNHNVSYIRYDEERLSIKAIDFINCLLDIEPNNRLALQTALDHPFLNPDNNEEFCPYKPLPKFTKKKEGGIKSLLKAVKKSKKQDIIAESEKVLNTLFSKNNDNNNKTEEATEPNYVENEEEEEEYNPNRITYSKTCVQSSNSRNIHQNNPHEPHFRNGHQNNVPEYLNVTMGRNNNYHNQNNGNVRDYDYDDVRLANARNQRQPEFDSNQVRINYPENYDTSSGKQQQNGHGNNPINYSKTYGGPRNVNNNNNNNNDPGINYSKTCLAPKPPKTAGNSIDPYTDFASLIIDDKVDDRNTNRLVNNNNSNNNNNNHLNPGKPPKTAGNSIDPYTDFASMILEDNNNNNHGKPPMKADNYIDPNGHNRTQSDNTQRVNHNRTQSDNVQGTNRNRTHSDASQRAYRQEEYMKYSTLPSRIRNEFNNNYNHGNSNRSPRMNQYNEGNHSPRMNQHNDGNGNHSPRMNHYNDGNGNHSPRMNHYNDGNGNHSPRMNHYNDGNGNHSPRMNHYNDGNGNHSPRMNHYNDGNGNNSPRMNQYNDGNDNRSPRMNQYNDGNGNHSPRMNQYGNNQSPRMNQYGNGNDNRSPRMNQYGNGNDNRSPRMNQYNDNDNRSPRINQYNDNSQGRPMNGYNKPSMRPSPLANAATIKQSNTIDEQYKRNNMNRENDSNRNNGHHHEGYYNNIDIKKDLEFNDDEAKSSKKDMDKLPDLKIKVNITKKQTKLSTKSPVHPDRNSSLRKKNRN